VKLGMNTVNILRSKWGLKGYKLIPVPDPMKRSQSSNQEVVDDKFLSFMKKFETIVLIFFDIDKFNLCKKLIILLINKNAS
jgi:hypothetical protein